MGTTRPLGRPKLVGWPKVTTAVQADASAAAIAAAIADVTARVLAAAPAEPAFAEPVRLFTEVLLATRGDFEAGLTDLGLPRYGAVTGLAGLAAGFTEAADSRIEGLDGRCEAVEQIEMAAAETLARVARGKDAAPSPGAVRSHLAAAATADAFAVAARQLFARYLHRHVAAYAARELPLHVGPGRAIRDLVAYQHLDEGFQAHCWRSTAGIEATARAWFSEVSRQGSVSDEAAKAFVGSAMREVVRAARDGA